MVLMMYAKQVKQGKKRGDGGDDKDDHEDDDDDEDDDDEENVCDIVPRSSLDGLMTGLDAEAG